MPDKWIGLHKEADSFLVYKAFAFFLYFSSYINVYVCLTVLGTGDETALILYILHIFLR